MNHRIFCSLTTIAAFFCQTSLAGTMGPIASENTWVVTLSAGPAWARAGETQSFYLTPYIEKKYVPRKSNEVLGSGEVFAGIQKSLSPHYLGQLGLAAAINSDNELHGIIWDDAIARFANHSYRYKVESKRLVLKGKLVQDNGYFLMPWVSASIGVGFNRSHAFSNTPFIYEAVENPNFQNKTKTAFSYALGAGVQKNITNYWQVGLGYEFTDWGNSRLNRTPEQTLNTGLKLDHLYTNGLIFSLSYVA